ncbi:ribonuclease H-like domain-containing protein [Tanacetum coccineum]
MTFDETPPPSKTSPLVDDDLDEEETIKLSENGIVSRNKARLVAQGYNQQEGIDYDKTYAPVARLESIRILLAYACALDFKLFQMDVKSAFLNDFINEEGTRIRIMAVPKVDRLENVVYADSDHAGDYVDQKSTSGEMTLEEELRAILEPWRQSHGLPPSPPSPPPNRTTPTSHISNNSLSSSSPPQNSTQNLNEIHHLSNLLDINLQQAIESTNPSPLTSPYIPPPSLDQSPLPKYYRDAFNDLNWQNAMRDEYNALIKNNTWVLVPRTADTKIVRCMWLFRHKYLADGTLSRYKARLVANGSTQLEGVNINETLSLVVKPGTIQIVLSLVVSRHWPIHQLDVKNAFLHGDLSETVYMHQPPGFWDSTHPNHGMDIAYLLLYVDDIVLTASSETLLQQIIGTLHQEFSMTDLGSLNYFLGIFVTRDSTGMFLSQRQNVVEILEQAGMVGCNSSRTPVDTESKLGVDGDPVSDPTFYRSLGTLDYGLYLFSSSTTDLVSYSDADWAGCPTTRRSTSGYFVFLGNNLLSWSSKRQPMISNSSAEAEYRGVANGVAETCWLRNLLRELHTPLSSATLIYCDNVSAVYLSCNPVQHQRTKHITIDIHFVRDLVVVGQVQVLHVPSRYQFADIFTKL